MRYVRLLIAIWAALGLIGSASVSAIGTAPSGSELIKVDGPFMIAGHSSTAYRLNYVQLYNAGNTVASLDGWTLFYTVDGTEFPLAVTLEGMMRPGASAIVADKDVVPTALFSYIAPMLETDTSLRITSLRLAAPEASDYNDHVVNPSYPSGSVASETQYAARNRSTSTGNFLSSFTTTTTAPTQLLQDELYVPPTETALRVLEVLANPRTCSPLDTAGGCRDYVKLYNPTTEEIDLSEYRIRVGYAGQVASSSNTVQLGGVLAPASYASYEVGVTNSGGWVWLEDSYGAMRYDETVVEYPDASAEAKKGYSWALGSAGWNWALPQPSAPNLLLKPEDAEAVASGLVPCAADQYRNPETNRCNKIAVQSSPSPCREDQYRSLETNRCRNITITSQLTPCDSDEYRSPETNRCRKLTTSSSGLTPCKAGQYRSLETNRCRSLATASTELKPCAPGQERNPETNRCRKSVLGDSAADFKVVDTPVGAENMLSWLALGGVGAATLGYAGWEWRRELWGGASKLFALLPWVK